MYGAGLHLDSRQVISSFPGLKKHTLPDLCLTYVALCIYLDCNRSVNTYLSKFAQDYLMLC